MKRDDACFPPQYPVLRVLVTVTPYLSMGLCGKHVHLPQTKGWTQRHKAVRQNSEREAVNDTLTRLGVWWAGTPKTVTANTFIPWQADPSLVPHWLSVKGL